MSIIDSKERAIRPFRFFPIWRSNNLQNDGYSILIVIPKITLGCECSISIDNTILISRETWLLSWLRYVCIVKMLPIWRNMMCSVKDNITSGRWGWLGLGNTAYALTIICPRSRIRNLLCHIFLMSILFLLHQFRDLFPQDSLFEFRLDLIRFVTIRKVEELLNFICSCLRCIIWICGVIGAVLCWVVKLSICKRFANSLFSHILLNVDSILLSLLKVLETLNVDSTWRRMCNWCRSLCPPMINTLWIQFYILRVEFMLVLIGVRSINILCRLLEWFPLVLGLQIIKCFGWTYLWALNPLYFLLGSLHHTHCQGFLRNIPSVIGLGILRTSWRLEVRGDATVRYRSCFIRCLQSAFSSIRLLLFNLMEIGVVWDLRCFLVEVRNMCFGS